MISPQVHALRTVQNYSMVHTVRKTANLTVMTRRAIELRAFVKTASRFKVVLTAYYRQTALTPSATLAFGDKHVLTHALNVAIALGVIDTRHDVLIANPVSMATNVPMCVHIRDVTLVSNQRETVSLAMQVNTGSTVTLIVAAAHQ